jgi:hypothetical protein
MVVQINLVADDGAATDQVAVSTSVEVHPSDPRWQARLVDAVMIQAEEGARRLVEQLEVLLPTVSKRFLPLAAIVRTIDERR